MVYAVLVTVKTDAGKVEEAVGSRPAGGSGTVESVEILRVIACA